MKLMVPLDRHTNYNKYGSDFVLNIQSSNLSPSALLTVLIKYDTCRFFNFLNVCSIFYSLGKLCYI